ncbi:hypothetical protein FKG94_05280 [Exilibacterium tricleocarpae]|uniref:Uncharacterized protein n=1 Tax=Exilibacterium tricleocarpae TaxID=2591008 RepID=A0A545U3M6_9GAMM|nr:hypothetical protein [Exilibacterium tricleocarpae]TQV84080.1 hypothetical protein FKG94_05280 [Exilibacterium tricleocarpae]
MKKTRYYLQEQVESREDAEKIEQLERILVIRKNRQERLQSKTRELRRNLMKKEKELQEERVKAQEMAEQTQLTIKLLRQENTKKVLTVNEIFHWNNMEVGLDKKVKKGFEGCDEIEQQKHVELFKLDEHMKTYKQAVIDTEKIALIKKELEEEQG